MDFTREPVVETILSPREGHKLAVRSSNRISQEEFFVDSLEIVSFGNSLFYRSLERPKNFLVPVNHYEVIEVRETRVVLKHATVEAKSIKIGVSKDSKPQQPPRRENKQSNGQDQQRVEPKENTQGKIDKKRDRRRTRRRKGKDDVEERFVEEREPPKVPELQDFQKSTPKLLKTPHPDAPPYVSTLLPPPRQLISETISKYKEFLIQKPPSEAPKNTEKMPEYTERPHIPVPQIPSSYKERYHDDEAVPSEEDPSTKRKPSRIRREIKKDEEIIAPPDSLET